MNKIGILIGTVFAFVSVAQAADLPLVQSTEIETASFLAFARAEDRQTLAEFLETSRPRRENLEKLMRLTQRAQGSWLSGQTTEARELFKQISDLALEDDWRESQREAISYSRLRLAQSAPTVTEQRDWLEKLVNYAPEYRPSADSFPPPLLGVLEEAKSGAKRTATELNLADRFLSYRFLIVNGRKFELSPRKKINLPPGVFRMTALSDSKPPLTEKMTAAELAQFRVLSSPLASGTCQAPTLSELSETRFQPLYAENCSPSQRKEVALTLPPRAAEWPTTEPTQAAGLSKKTWWLIGATVVVTGLALSLNKINEKRVEPTARQGF